MLYLLIILLVPLVALLQRSFLSQRVKKNNDVNKTKGKILYLRSFHRDGEGTEMSPSLMNPLAFIANNKGTPHELELAAELTGLGQLIAIGKPNEEIPDIGFERLYFTDDEWQTAVLQFMEESRLIVYRPDATANVFWEFEQLMKNNYLRKTIIWNGAHLTLESDLQKARFEILRRKLKTLYDISLPKYHQFKKFLSINDTGQWSLSFGVNQTGAYRRATTE
jgi:hypothetical protein